MLIFDKRALYNFKMIERKLYEEIHFRVNNIIPLFQTIPKIRQKFKNDSIVNKKSHIVTLIYYTSLGGGGGGGSLRVPWGFGDPNTKPYKSHYIITLDYSTSYLS